MSSPLRIRTAKDLIEALGSSDPKIRLATLKTIVAHPQQAVAFGAYQGRDVVDMLIDQTTRAQMYAEWLSMLGALAALHDHRVVTFFVQLLTTSEEPEILFLAADRLAQEPVEVLHPILTPLLLQNTSGARARAVASILTSAATLSLEEQVRVYMVSDGEPKWERPRIPLCNDETASIWGAELEGIFCLEARDCLEEQGERAFVLMAHRWDQLSDDTRAWLLHWGAQNWPHHTTALLERAVESDSARVVLAALEHIPRAGENMIHLRPRFSHFLQHPNREVRLAAIKAGARGGDWRARLSTESDPQIRRACVSRLAEEEGIRALPDLLRLLYEEDWQMRAIATEVLISLGDSVVATVQPLIHETNPAVRVSAVRILLVLGKEAL